jgi:DNA helicase HerA-like ATPase
MRFQRIERDDTGIPGSSLEQDGFGHLGVVTEGSYSTGLVVRLFPDCDAEGLRIGSFVVLEGERHRYFGTITDIRLRATDAALTADPPARGSAFVRRVVRGTHAYVTVDVRPALVLEDPLSLTGSKPKPARTIPAHFAMLRHATPLDFELVFGKEDRCRFALGTPPMMDIPIPIDLDVLVQRSNGIFGMSGSGKSVLTRLILFGLVKADIASALIFDMHSEYARAPIDQPEITGLAELFGHSRIRVFTLDPLTDDAAASRSVRIGLNQIEPEDIELLAQELNLNPTFTTVAHHLRRRFGERWIARVLSFSDEDVKEFCSETGAHPASVDALRSKLPRIADRPYVVEQADSSVLDDILTHLERGRHVILQFGRYDSLLDYMLVANLVTRRIHQRYVEQALTQGQLGAPASQRRRLVIVLEEAHKFLAPEAARQSIFGIIAREMRKYWVTLLVVDQRPSGIEPEVLSQLGTKIIGPLADQHDIDAVLTGVSDRSQMRNLLANLSPQQECLVVGHAVPMPILLRTRSYDGQALRRELQRSGIGAADGVTAHRLLFGEEPPA